MFHREVATQMPDLPHTFIGASSLLAGTRPQCAVCGHERRYDLHEAQEAGQRHPRERAAVRHDVMSMRQFG